MSEEKKDKENANLKELFINSARKPSKTEKQVQKAHTDVPPRCECPSSGSKWLFALLAAVLFFILASSVAFRVTGAISMGLGGPALATGGATWLGLIIHAVVFGLIIRLVLW